MTLLHRMWMVSLPLLLIVPHASAGAAPATQPSRYLAAALTVTESIQKQFYDPRTGFYAQALDKRNPDFMWGNGIMFSTLVAAARHQPGTYRPLMDRFFTTMDKYWDTKVKIPGYEPAPTRGGGNDKYYDDNAWMVITFLEAYDLTRDVKYLDRAQHTLAFVLSGWDDTLGGGIWWHEKHKSNSKNTCSNGPAAVGCLRLARYRLRRDNIDWAKKIVAWTNEHLQDRDGLFFDSQHADTGKIDKGKLTYNTALMIRAYLGLHRATGDETFLKEAQRVGKASDWFLARNSTAYRDAPKWAHLMVEADLELWRATGAEYAMNRARGNADAMFARWQKDPPKELLDQAGIARTLWLLADHETSVGRAFWKRSDEPAPTGR